MSRRDAPDGSQLEQLMAAARARPAVRYDVERGLARHRQLQLADAPLPEWAGPLTRARGWLHASALKGLVGVLLVSGFFALRQSAPPPSAAAHPAPEPVTNAAAAAAAPDTSHDEAPLTTAAPPRPDSEPAVQRAARVPAAHRTRSPEPPGAGPRREHPVPARAPPAPAVEREPLSAAPSGTESAPATPTEVLRFEHKPFERAEPPADADELRWLARAERALPDDPARALQLLREGDARFPDGYFRQERAYLTIMASFALGQRDAARARARDFLARYPRSPYAERVRATLRSIE